MDGPVIAAIISRELRTMVRELEGYASDDQVWEKPDALPNSAGTLAAHVAGNLRGLIGAVLGQNGYVRDRDREFSVRGVSRGELIRDLRAADVAVRSALEGKSAGELGASFPIPVANHRQVTGELVLHLAVHLAYHLGQVDYHRRIVTGDPGGVGAVSPAELPGATRVE